MARPTPQEMADYMADFVNTLSDSDNKPFAKEMTNKHRTLQQGAMRLFLSLCEEWAEQEKAGRYDLRNEATVKLAKRILEVVDDSEVYIPYI